MEHLKCFHGQVVVPEPWVRKRLLYRIFISFNFLSEFRTLLFTNFNKDSLLYLLQGISNDLNCFQSVKCFPKFFIPMTVARVRLKTCNHALIRSPGRGGGGDWAFLSLFFSVSFSHVFVFVREEIRVSKFVFGWPPKPKTIIHCKSVYERKFVIRNTVK
jgi:hypothetical protein